ncbi:MAG: hypothetical protein SGCHY_003440 [Lobulomycetales sp.]
MGIYVSCFAITRFQNLADQVGLSFSPAPGEILVLRGVIWISSGLLVAVLLTGIIFHMSYILLLVWRTSSKIQEMKRAGVGALIEGFRRKMFGYLALVGVFGITAGVLYFFRLGRFVFLVSLCGTMTCFYFLEFLNNGLVELGNVEKDHLDETRAKKKITVHSSVKREMGIEHERRI